MPGTATAPGASAARGARAMSAAPAASATSSTTVVFGATRRLRLEERSRRGARPVGPELAEPRGQRRHRRRIAWIAGDVRQLERIADDVVELLLPRDELVVLP